jgi:DNA-binding MarR family transcriptional regulator
VSFEDVAARLQQFIRLHRPGGPRSPGWLAHDLTFSQVRVLFLLRDEGPVAMSRLAAALGVTAATASGVIERLERHGLVARRHRADDRRVVECALADEGERLLREMAGAHVDALRRTLAVLSPAELAEFHRLLGLIVERHGAASSPSGTGA